MSMKNGPVTKAQRREAARAEALALQRKQAQRDKRNRAITLGVLAIAVVALAVVVWMIVREGGRSGMEKVDSIPSSATIAEGTGIPIGAGGVAGVVNEGAPEVATYLDFLCPHCAEFEAANGESLRSMLDNGDATLVVHPIAIVDPSADGHSVRGATAFAWVADNAPESAFDYQQLLFENQPSGDGLSDQQLADLAEQAGVPADVADGIADGTAHETFQEWVEAATAQASSNEELRSDEGGFGTPTVTIDGHRWEGNWQEVGALQEAVTG